jgi:putative ABC transport system ATP-binding protein
MSSTSTLVDIVGISKSYRMGELMVNALKDVSLRIDGGEFVVALGPSGSGKTTLLNLIGGIDAVNAGHIVINGTDITTLDDRLLTDFRRHNFGYVFQFFNLIPTLTARENVDFAAELVNHPADSLEMLATVGLKDRADHFPSELSGGEQQRVAIARALVKDPPILLCDEPTGELDYETGKNILGTIRRLSREKGKTVLLVTHNSAIGGIADRVIRMRSGNLVEDKRNPSPEDPSQLRW